MKYTDFVRSQVDHMVIGDVTVVDTGDKSLGYFRTVLSQLYNGEFKTRTTNGLVTVERVKPSGKVVHHVKPLLWSLNLGESVLLESPHFTHEQLRQAVYIVNKTSDRKFRTKEVPITRGSDVIRLFAQRKVDKS